MKIGVCTGGGDCPGLNAAIRAIVKNTVGNYGGTVIGIEDSFNGLIERPLRVKTLELDSVTEILDRGGTILGTTNKGDPFAFEVNGSTVDVSARITEAYRQLGLDALIVIGGDGTQQISWRLASLGINLIGIPKTIDNDLPGTDVAIGFDSALEIAAEAATRLRSTAESHDRIMILEVMGRNSGYIALSTGIAGGANIILLPEIPFQYEPIVAKIAERRALGRYFSLIVVAEGAYEAGKEASYAEVAGSSKRLGGIGQMVSQVLHEKTGMETRVTVLGHVQRGGMPTANDRILATALGAHAVELAARKRYGRIVVLRGREIGDVHYKDVAGQTRFIDISKDPYIKAAEEVGICLGRPLPFKTKKTLKD